MADEVPEVPVGSYAEYKGVCGFVDPYRKRWEPNRTLPKMFCLLQLGTDIPIGRIKSGWKNVAIVTFDRQGRRKEFKVDQLAALGAELASWKQYRESGWPKETKLNESDILIFIAKYAETLTDLGAVESVRSVPLHLPWTSAVFLRLSLRDHSDVAGLSEEWRALVERE